jgi:AbrB family looped-hinge helix DNA binding protein
METTKLSTKGQLVLPKAIRDARALKPGTEFTVEDTKDGIVFRPKRRVPRKTIDEVFGMLKWKGKPATLKDMDDAIAEAVIERYERSRY